MREMLIRLIYCEMLGVECPWGYIHAVKMTQSTNIMDKRIGECVAMHTHACACVHIVWSYMLHTNKIKK